MRKRMSMRRPSWSAWHSVGGASVLALTLTIGAAAQPDGRAGVSPRVYQPVAPEVLEADMDTAFRAMAVRPWREGDPVRVVEDLEEDAGPSPPVEGPRPAGLRAEAVAAPTIGVNFEGIPATGVLPPDAVGDVGPKHYIQAVNSAFSIYDKSGTQLAGPTPINALWAAFGGPCESENDGDPIVRYDHLADRWLIAQFAVPGDAAGLHECVAVSRTSDPVAGGWFLYDFPTQDATGQPVFPDYPKIGVWPDAYYMGTQRGFPNSGLDVWAFDRTQMLAGAPAGLVQFSLPRPSLFLMPADLDGTPPPAGTPGFFARQVDGERFGGADRLEVFAFQVDWANPAASTFTQVADLKTDPFDSVLCTADLLGACVPQPGVAQRLETLTVWPMWRLQYRNFGAHEAMVVNHTVDANGQDRAGVRWYELRRAPAGAWGIFQQGTYAPDETHRWMASVAMDQSGNIALGYSVASDRVFPGLRFTGRMVGDPPGTLPQPETDIVVGAGAQTHAAARWGNYSSLDVDPVDGCTFWYTGEYFPSTSSAGWRTRIVSFRNGECGAPPSPEAGEFEFTYAAKVVCGIQPDPKLTKLVRGFYGSAINIFNPGEEPVSMRKQLALTSPPEEEKPGKVLKIAEEKLPGGEALEVDCLDLEREAFGGQLPDRYIKGFVVIRSTGRLVVTGVYSAAELGRDDEIGSVQSVDVEQVKGVRQRRPGAQCPDLVVQDIGPPQVSCPGGPGTCTTTFSYTIGNIGAAAAGPFTILSVLDPSASVTVQQMSAGLAAGATQPMTATTPPGGNCFDPDCSISVTVDSGNQVKECDETNNKRESGTIG